MEEQRAVTPTPAPSTTPDPHATTDPVVQHADKTA